MNSVFNTEFNVIYTRVVQGCNLNCSHCFTLGDQDPQALTPLDYIERYFKLLRQHVNPKKAVLYIHGGETFLAPLTYLHEVNQLAHSIFDETKLDIIPQTNLTYGVDDTFIEFIRTEYHNTIGVSWDADIRFRTPKQERLFFTNLRKLLDAKVNVHIAITVQKHLLDRDPIEVVRQFDGVSSIDFELLTTFNAMTRHLKVNNEHWSEWYYRIAQYYLEHEVTWSLPMADLLVRSLYHGDIQDCKCNCCDRRTFTLNPNGSVGLCPDRTYIEPLGTLDGLENDWSSFEQAVQLKVIDKLGQSVGHEMCYECEFYELCGGNCESSLFDHTTECPMSKKTLALILDNRDQFKDLLEQRGLKQLTELIN